MSQANYELIQGVMQAAADSFDGAFDEKGQPLEIGLKREKGHPVLDSRQIDGFRCKIDGSHLQITYHSEIKLKDVYGGNLEKELEQTMADIVNHLKKKYKQNTSKTLRLTPAGEVDAIVEKTSNVRVWVVAKKVYRIPGLSGVEDRLAPSADRLEVDFKKFLEQGSGGSKNGS